jgi:hypothetical protein
MSVWIDVIVPAGGSITTTDKYNKTNDELRKCCQTATGFQKKTVKSVRDVS